MTNKMAATLTGDFRAMPKPLPYSLSTVENRSLAEHDENDCREMLPVIRQLTSPKTSLYTHPHGLAGYPTARPALGMNKTSLWLLALLLAGCASAEQDRARAEKQRDARLAGLLMIPGDLPKAAAPSTASADDSSSTPDYSEQNRCKDKDRHGDKSGKCGRDDDKHDNGSH